MLNFDFGIRRMGGLMLIGVGVMIVASTPQALPRLAQTSSTALIRGAHEPYQTSSTSEITDDIDLLAAESWFNRDHGGDFHPDPPHLF
ncbi:hypothetical protein GW571_14890 (plasmid) [Clavibacter capsici]|uniref:Uncharacterized protein n=1 Tax=Clavibacter capsici TaxID=1874630 RepID=A0AAE6XSY6_9MICO|nr:hypothetical protein [Clavibacter capsici]QIS40550.1 hypothetical protein GW572_15335 [Clavibacter capsici]QIS43519.1 hypothetical protein GW571_14890 [Clavibacter capsici]QIS46435.1 hypothetical protein GW570_14665 [Clavibacter capsici]